MRFHPHLYKFVLEHKPQVMVETGFATGLSAVNIVAAMDVNECGQLWSVESYTQPSFKHSRLNFVRGMSRDKLVEIYVESGPWDIFLHDSDHEAWNMTFELELAWSFLKPGGILMLDDYDWGTHKAWPKFMERHGIKDAALLEGLAYCMKPLCEEVPAPNVEFFTRCHDAAVKCADHV